MHANFKDTVWGNKDNALYGISLYYDNMLSIIINDNYLASKVGSVFSNECLLLNVSSIQILS